MKDRLKGVLIATGVIAALAAGGAAVAGATGGSDSADNHAADGDRPISGSALDRAKQVALGETGGGKVTETEAGDEESYYQVEVTNPDGSQTDVNLDRGFNVVATKTEREGSGDKAD